MKLSQILFCMLLGILSLHINCYAVKPVSVTTPNGERVTLQPFKTGAYQVMYIEKDHQAIPAYGVLYYCQCQMDGCCMIGLDIMVGDLRIRKSIGIPEDWTYDNLNQVFICEYEDDTFDFVTSVSPLTKGEQIFTYVTKDFQIGLVYSLNDFKKYKGEVVMRKILELD